MNKLRKKLKTNIYSLILKMKNFKLQSLKQFKESIKNNKNYNSKIKKMISRKTISIAIFLLLTSFYLLNNKSNHKNEADEHAFKSPNKTFAIISINLDTNLEFYLFYLPMTCLSWRLVNYEPIIIAVTSNVTKSNKLATKTLEYLNLFQVKVILIESVANYEKMTGMLARLFVGLIKDDLISNNDIIFQTDADLIPINKKYYQSFDKSDSIKILDVSSFQSPIGKFSYKMKSYQMYFMGHIGMKQSINISIKFMKTFSLGMKKWQWKEIMHFYTTTGYKLNGESILKLVKKYYGESLIKKNDEIKRGDNVWFLDQHIISINIAKYLRNRNNKLFTKLSPGIKLDRIWSDEKWLTTFNSKYESINDVHLFHENYVQKMKFLLLLFKKLFNKHQMIIFDKYIREFMSLKNVLIN